MLKKFSLLLVSYLARLYVFIIWVTSRKYITADEESLAILDKGEKVVLALWHGRLLIFPKLMQKYGHFNAIVSSHKDGRYLSSYIAHYGHATIEGSTNRGAFNAMRNALKALNANERIAITPDGPKGPRFKINSNILRLTQKTNTSIIPICYSCSKAKILGSWDKFILPKPFSELFIEIGKPLSSDTVTEKLETVMLEQMNRLDKKAKIKLD